MTQADPTLLRELNAMCDWWRAAGVDYDFADDATAWLGERPSAETAERPGKPTGDEQLASQRGDTTSPRHTAKSPPAAADLLGDSPPESLDAFREFWLTAPGLDAIGPRGRVPPCGESGVKLMVLVTDPEETDSDTLLSGPQGRLLDRMLGAMGYARDDIYLASALTRHTPMADTARLAASGMAAVTRLHINLAAPEKVIAFGSNILPLIGHELPKELTSLREINLVDPPIPLLVSEGFDSLMAMPRLKARFWRRWSEWSVER
ncbi:hypothetical protein [Erythrobacter sp. JK5]|uniref:hypothetical protein n=1 Tax=Erythrobacter sp. JK5 TaxID=2829500 RepID=UPI001BA9E09A|nr:hypothetical protein [Erythrobacter sp. JK5]QUL38583.1 hypothetical protein KDC96_04075 [Erythrobacter sp. JK5]